MKNASLVGLLLTLTLLALPASGSATIVFSAYADAPEIYTGGCTPGGTIMTVSSYHLGTIASMDPGDSGRHFEVNGSLGKCSSFFAMATCSDQGTAGSDNSASCTAYSSTRCPASFKGKTDVAVLVGSESAHAESSCSSCS